MSLPENIPLPGVGGILGSRKIRLKKDSPVKPQVLVSDGLLESDNLSENSTPVGFDSPITNDSKSNLVDSVFSNFVAKKMEEVEKDRKGKKVKHKKEKHKKHKHKDKVKEKVSGKKNGETASKTGGGFFAKEKFLDPGMTEKTDLSDNSDMTDENHHKSKKKKKHKKHKEHKHKHKSKDRSTENVGKPQKQSNSKLLSFHEDLLPDPDIQIPVKHEVAQNMAVVAAAKKVNPKNLFADKMEKALELKLSTLKDNLTKKHKALEDLGKEVTIPEKKIKMMADFTVSEKLKGLRDSDPCSKSVVQPSRGVVNSVTETRRQSSESTFKIVEVVPDVKTKEEAGVEKEVKKTDQENHCVETKTDQVTVQVSNSEKQVTDGDQDEDGFRAMKPKRKLGEAKEDEEEIESKLGTTTQVGKKSLGMSLGLKLSENSKSLISSGVKIENDPKKRNREEGEITDSQEDSHQTSSSSADSEDGSSSGEIKEDKGRRKKKKDREKRRLSSERRKKARSRSRTPRKRRRSRSYDEEKGVWKSKSRRRRSRSRSRDRRRRSRDRDYRRRSRSRSSDRRDRHFYYNDRYRKSRSRERSKERENKTSEDLRLKIDKAKLRQIAMKNAYTMLSNEDTMKNLKPDQLAAIKAGGKSVEELTDFCRKIAEKDPRRNSSSEEEFRLHSDTEEDATQPFVNHPFAVKPAPNIALNIRNAKQLPLTTFADRTAKAGELRLQFPVSSGSQHKNKEDTWTPVEKTTAPPTKPVTTATTAQAPVKSLPKPGPIKPPPVVSTPAITMEEPKPEEMPAVREEDRVFPDNKMLDINISDVVSERLHAMRKLQCNPHDSEAIGAMYKAQKAMNEWAVVKEEPGKFTGHTGLKGLSQKQLHGSGFQAWIKKDMFRKAAPVRGGIGRLLLQKMGWREGTGLGKDETGSVQPLNLELKTDRKGLSVADELPAAPASKANKAPPVRDLSGKHPVSALMEICKRRKWNQPQFDMVFDCGPPHKKDFVFKVHVNGVDYQPTIASPNKKHAKAQAATVALQNFGLIPKDGPI